jgi:hypothetical protein
MLPSILQITVPVTIEHPPPEMRGATSLSPPLPPPLRPPPIARQETLHTDSGLDTEEIVPASPQREVIAAPIIVPAAPPTPVAAVVALATVAIPAGLHTLTYLPESYPDYVFLGDEVVDGVRMVLVRDIGVQVCGDSPSLNLTRRFPRPQQQPEQQLQLQQLQQQPKKQQQQQQQQQQQPQQQQQLQLRLQLQREEQRQTVQVEVEVEVVRERSEDEGASPTTPAKKNESKKKKRKRKKREKEKSVALTAVAIESPASDLNAVSASKQRESPFPTEILF